MLAVARIDRQIANFASYTGPLCYALYAHHAFYYPTQLPHGVGGMTGQDR